MLVDITLDVIEQYTLQETATDDGWLYVEILKVLYGLPQARFLAQEQLEQQLALKCIIKASRPLHCGHTKH